MNYRHAYHAGNHADVFKHVMLLYCLAALKRKDKPFAVLDTHAGIGLYDLAADEAQRSPEWQGGIARIFAERDAPASVRAYLDAVRAHNLEGALRLYPGSPHLIADALREQDRLIACDLHGADCERLKARFVRDARVQVHARDGYEAALALTPFAEKRGLVFIDPPFERADDFDRSLDCIQGVLSRFRQAMILWWRPLKDARALARVDATAASFGVESTRLDFAIGTAAPTGPLRASSLLLFNPPFGAAAEGECVRDWLTPRLALSP